MKLSISDTRTTVTIEVAGNDLQIQEVGDLLRQLLLGFGYVESTVDELIEPR